MNSKLFYSAIFALALAGGTYFAVGGGSGNQSTAFDLSAQAQSAEEIDTSDIAEISMGSEDAPVTMIEYASFTCPHCASFHENVFDRLKADYIDTGKVHFIYREIYFDRPGLWAGMLARCAGPMRYFGIADMIYEEQSDWARAGDGAAISGALRKIGLKAGLDGDQIEACLTDAEKAQAMYALFQQNAEADNITSTPSFVIDGEKHTNMPYDELQAILDEAVGDFTPAAAEEEMPEEDAGTGSNN